MTEETHFNLQEMACPNCGAPRMGVVDNRRLVCAYCNADFVIAETICPECANFNEPGTDYCTQCGTAISRLCPACGTRNWANAEICEHCGRRLDVIENMAARWHQSTQRRLQEQMAEAPALKRREEESARTRSAALWESEDRRQQTLRQAQAARDVQEQRLMTVAVIALLVFIAIVVVVIAFQIMKG
jgi:predicted amidophosphoribosyltransferase